MIKKFLSMLAAFILLFSMCFNCYAATINSSKATMTVEDKSVCEIKLEDYGKFTKELTKFDESKKEVELTLSITNTSEAEVVNKPAEVFLILDNSNSMNSDYNEKAKKQYVIETATTFVNSMFNSVQNLKMGIVSFSSVDPLVNTNTTLGTQSDAKLLLELSDSQDAIVNAIKNYTDDAGPYTNIEAGLAMAEKSFSANTSSEKYVILISDGVPNLCLNTSTTLEYSRTIADSTKTTLNNMKNNGYHIYSVLMGLNESLTPLTGSNALTIADGSRVMTYQEYAQEIFGTSSNPTSGSFYYIDYSSLSNIVNVDIFNDITEVKDNGLKNIIIKDYFPKEIIENFNFEYVKTPNIGSVSTEINHDDNSITWNIELLKEGETATLVYALTLKDEFNEEIVNKLVNTNEKVEISFETVDGNGDVFSDVSPKVKLVVEDQTVAKDPIPQTGKYNYIFIILGFGVAIFAIIKFTKIINIK